MPATQSNNQTVAITDIVAAVTRKAILLKSCARPSYAEHNQEWIAKSQIVEADCEIDDIVIGEEITIEIPLWLAREKGMAE